MHGIFDVFGYSIVISFAAALLLSLFTGFNSVKCALIVACTLLLIVLTYTLLETSTALAAVMSIIIAVLALVIGMIGSLPGAALGRKLRSAFLRREY